MPPAEPLEVRGGAAPASGQSESVHRASKPVHRGLNSVHRGLKSVHRGLKSVHRGLSLSKPDASGPASTGSTGGVGLGPQPAVRDLAASTGGT